MGRRRLTPARLHVIRLGSVTQQGRHLWRVREGRRAVPESLGLGPDRVVGLASFLNQERRMLHDEIHRGNRLPTVLRGGVMSMKLGTRAMHTCALA
mgnify:CR=1 FL=1